MKALALRPDDEDIGRELAVIDRQVKIEQDNERALCRRMFDNQVRLIVIYINKREIVSFRTTTDMKTKCITTFTTNNAYK